MTRQRKSTEESEQPALPQNTDNGPDRQGGSPGPPIPPDGGWGWMIMFASFLVNVIVDGVCFSFGIFYLEFLDYYRASKSKTSWVGSVLNGMYLSMGPIVSALANKFGCRAVTIAGSILATAAYILSTFSPNIDALIITYGALGGMGFGLMYLPAIVMVGFYFEKRRAFATGVAVCGSGIGAFAFAPLSETLIANYGWKGATMIIAGIVLNGVVCGALFRPLEVQRSREKIRDLEKNGSAVDHNHTSVQKSVSADSANEYSSVDKSTTGSPQPIKAPLPKHIEIPALKINGMSQEPNLASSCRSLPCQFDATENGGSHCYRSMHALPSAELSEDHSKRIKDLQRPLYRKDIFYSGSITHLPEFQAQKDQESYVRSVTHIPGQSSRAEKGRSGCARMMGSIVEVFREMMDFSLLKNPVFALYGLSCFLCMMGFFVPFTYLPDYAVGLGISRGRAAFLVSIIGIANTVARVASGWVSDQPWADCLLINNCALVIGGVATILCPFCISYGLLATYSCVFGACIAVFVSLRSIIMVELLGLDRLTNSFGLVTMCQGLSSFIGAPIAGSLFDWTGNYSISFYMAGGTLALAGLICFPLRRIAAWQSKKEMEKLGQGEIRSKAEEHILIVTADTNAAKV